MSTITLQEIQRDLTTFLERLGAGETFLILKDKTPLAEIRPVVTPTAQLRPFGLCAGQFTVPPNFDEPLPDELLAGFEGS
jgi:antitoxin (DNA-binding transcriptional repressor) of toxin-antitoxin stability system